MNYIDKQFKTTDNYVETDVGEDDEVKYPQKHIIDDEDDAMEAGL